MSINNYPGESVVTHRICEIDGQMCELGILAASLADDANQLRVGLQQQLEAKANEAANRIRQRHEDIIAQRPGIEKYLDELTQSTIQKLESVVPELNLCRAVCEGRRRLLGCGVKTVES